MILRAQDHLMGAEGREANDEAASAEASRARFRAPPPKEEGDPDEVTAAAAARLEYAKRELVYLTAQRDALSSLDKSPAVLRAESRNV